MPILWKRSYVVPVFKSGDKHNIENYRPISKLSTIANLFEKIVYDFIYPELRSTIINEQHGFVDKKSTDTNVCELVHYVSTAMDQGIQVDVVYTDYSKAFDKISHSILIRKLGEVGIHGDLLRWLTSYLRDRSQAVTIKGYCSTFVPIPSGVPQGSHLGPLLFNLYINDIINIFEQSSILLYADDMKIFKRILTTSDCELLQNDLDHLYEYCLKNSLTLNIKKCNAISFSRKLRLIQYNYNLNSNQLTRVAEMRDLGIYLDTKLTFNYHINYIFDKAYRMLGFILRVGNDFKNIDTLILLFNTIVRSILEYGSVVWNPSYVTYIDKLEKIQNKFMKHVKYRSFASKQQCPSITSLHNRRIERDQIFLFKIVRNLIDSP